MSALRTYVWWWRICGPRIGCGRGFNTIKTLSTNCHPERSEGSASFRELQIPRFARDDKLIIDSRLQTVKRLWRQDPRSAYVFGGLAVRERCRRESIGRVRAGREDNAKCLASRRRLSRTRARIKWREPARPARVSGRSHGRIRSRCDRSKQT